MSRAGYNGKHGSFTVPIDDRSRMLGIYLQVTVGNASAQSKPRISTINETAYATWISIDG